jgi:triphosphoribosyl-dephospho-CoA synthase
VSLPADNPTGDHVAHVARCVELACVLEATALKPGNVHPHASFGDATFRDFTRAARVVAPILAGTRPRTVGLTILEAITRTREAVPHNVNLGLVLVLAPLCAVPGDRLLRSGIADVLAGLTEEDARHAYEAIRLAAPGGLGNVTENDVAAPPTGTLRDVMRLAAERDTIAAEYAEGFPLILEFALPRLEVLDDFTHRWDEHVVRLHLELMARTPDTLIARKCGRDVAEESASRAYDVLAAGWPEVRLGRELFREFDAWLRADGHRRNPGTTADLVAGCLFAGFRDRLLKPPADVALDRG